MHRSRSCRNGGSGYRIRLYVTANCTYNRKMIGSITNLKITVANNTDYTMDAVKVRAAYLKQAGGVYKYEEINFNGILPHSQMALSAPNSDKKNSRAIRNRNDIVQPVKVVVYG